MRFSTVATALLSLAASAAAQGPEIPATAGSSPSTTFMPMGGQPMQCRRFNTVNWKAFNAEKKVVALVAKDSQGNVIGKQNVKPQTGSTQMMMPESFGRFVKFFLVDAQTNAIYAEGEQVEVDCPKNMMNMHNGPNGGKMAPNPPTGGKNGRNGGNNANGRKGNNAPLSDDGLDNDIDDGSDDDTFDLN